MHVIVVGAGEVGSYVAERLSREGHDVAIIDRDRAHLRDIEDRLDVLTVRGSGTHPSTLEEAGLAKADLLVAVTNVDEVNLVSCLVARQAGVARTIARLEDEELRSGSARRIHEAVGVGLVIDPDEETVAEILEVLEYPGATEVAEMAGGEVVVIGARLAPHAPVVGRTLLEIAQHYEPEWEFLFGTITRGPETIIPRGNQTLEANDLVRVVCKRRARRQLTELLGLTRREARRVMVLGGGRTAELLAARLVDRGATVSIVERDPERAQELAERLDRVLVLQGEITDSDLLEEEGIASADAVIALTGEDDANILACLYAKAAGAQETVAVVHRLSLLPLLSQAGIDVALSPRTAIANAVLRFVRGDVAAVATFLQGEAEVLEFEVKRASPAVQAIVAELRLPKDMLLAAIVRDGKAQIARGRSQLREHDHVIAFAMPHAVEKARRVFG